VRFLEENSDELEVVGRLLPRFINETTIREMEFGCLNRFLRSLRSVEMTVYSRSSRHAVLWPAKRGVFLGDYAGNAEDWANFA